MKVATTSDRLKYLMETRNMRQADIFEKIQPFCESYGVNIPRNALSQYITGKVCPKQDKLSILGMALDVSEVWLMGYDVPMEREKERAPMSDEPMEREELAKLFESLSPENQQKLLDYARVLSIAQQAGNDPQK